MTAKQRRQPQQRKPKRMGNAGAGKKEKGPFDLPKDQEIYVINSGGRAKMNKGGCAQLTGFGKARRPKK